METQIGKSGLQIPVQTLGKKAQLNMDLESIKKWRAELPMADTGASAKKIFIALNELNQTTLETEKRLEILELLRPPLQLIGQALKKHYLNPTTVLKKQKFTIANLAQTIQLEAASGYKIVLEEMLYKKDTSKVNAPLTIYRIMQYYTMICLRNYQLYAKEPEAIWQELHILYKCAKKENILDLSIDGASANQNHIATIFSNYIHLLLLAASNPFQWRQNEQDSINNLAHAWVGQTIFRPYTKDDALKPGVFIVDLEKDLPVLPIGLQKNVPSKACMVLDLTKLCGHLKKIAVTLSANEIQTKISSQNEPEYILSSATIQRLIYTLSSTITRKTKRFAISGKVQAVCGLSATHFHVGGGQPFSPDNIKKDNSSFQEVGALELTEELPAANTGASELVAGLASLQLDSADNQYRMLNKKEHEKYIIHDCSLLDISPTGACISWEIHTYSLAQPGDIIAINTNPNVSAAENSNAWSIGVIRWVKQLDENNIRVGIQLLAAYANAAGAQVLKDDAPACYFLRCLLLPKMEDLSMNATIITPNVPFTQGKYVNLFTSSIDPIIKIQLTKQIDATSSYRQFEYSSEQSIDIAKMIRENHADKQAAKEKATPQQRKQIANDVTDKFKSIWDEL